MSLLLFYVVLIVMFFFIIYIILNLICECSVLKWFCSSFCIFSFVPYWEHQRFFSQWAVLWSIRVTVTQQVCWPPGGSWEARGPGPLIPSTPATLIQTPRSTGRSKTASTRWRGGWRQSSQTLWREWQRRRRRRRPKGWSCSSTSCPGKQNVKKLQAWEILKSLRCF